MSNKIITFPNKVKTNSVSTAFKPVTQTALVAVNKASTYEIFQLLLLAALDKNCLNDD